MRKEYLTSIETLRYNLKVLEDLQKRIRYFLQEIEELDKE